MIASRRARSAALTSTLIPVRIPQTRIRASRWESPAGLFRQSLTTRSFEGRQPRIEVCLGYFSIFQYLYRADGGPFSGSQRAGNGDERLSGYRWLLFLIDPDRG